ncbi:MAG: CinA family protein, partial [Corynebacterium sp.]|nr:CinA family protein [Corynebacterium sp.]
EPEDVLAQTEHHALALLYSSMVESINHQEKNT